MAHLYKRARSPFWWIKFRDTATGKLVRESTGFRYGRSDETRRADALEAERTLEERRLATARQVSRFENWVEDYLEHHYANPLSLARARHAWSGMRTYLHQLGIYSPEHVRREHCLNYLTWRLKGGHGNSPNARKISRNTAILDLKLFGKIMNEAVHRGWIEYNVAYRLGIERARSKERAEMTDAHVAIIRAAIAKKLASPANEGEKANADFLHVSFEIALRQGIRMRETHFHLRDHVNLEAQTLTLRAKGKDDLVQPINPDLLPLLRDLIGQGREWTYELPRMSSLVWFKFFNALRARHPELRHITFHSTRVRIISRLERAGAPEPIVKKMVNHASTTVHRVYRRVKREELDPFWHALRSAALPSPTASSPADAPHGHTTSEAPSPTSEPDQ